VEQALVDDRSPYGLPKKPSCDEAGSSAFYGRAVREDKISYNMRTGEKYYIAYYTLSWRQLGERYLTGRENAKKYLEYVLYSDFLEHANDEFLEDVLQKADKAESMHKFIYRNRYFLIKKISDM